MDWCQRTSETEPVPGGDIPFRNCDEARKPRLGSEQIVIIGIEIAIRAAVADGEQLAVGIEQEGKIHGIEKAFCMVSDFGEAMRHGSAGVHGAFESRHQWLIPFVFPMPLKDIQRCLAMLGEAVERRHDVQHMHDIRGRRGTGNQACPRQKG